MIVIRLSACPSSLRGDLSKWLCEVDSNLFVGRVSSKVRENLWSRVCMSIGNGSATLIYNTNNEQGFDFRVKRKDAEIVDLDGFKLIMRTDITKQK